jgi:hypothetical protein
MRSSCWSLSHREIPDGVVEAPLDTAVVVAGGDRDEVAMGSLGASEAPDEMKPASAVSGAGGS